VSRLPPLDRAALDDRGAAVWDTVAGTRGPEMVDGDGHLIGPFNAFAHAPGVGARLAELGTELRRNTSIDRRLLEVAIITVGARWRAEFEWWAHARMAREQGVADEVVDAIGDGTTPPFARDDERVVHAAAAMMADVGRLDDATYDAAHRLLGDVGMVELTALCGYYSLISFLLNTFEVPLPPGQPARWAG
jgi:4-carboxymuconolactone decarboxylase